MATFTATNSKSRVSWQAPEGGGNTTYFLNVGSGYNLLVATGYKLVIQPGRIGNVWTNTSKL